MRTQTPQKPLAWHLVFRAVDSAVLAPDAASQRRLADTIHTRAEGRGLLAFRAAGEHLHLQARCSREEAGALAKAIGAALTQRLGLAGFASTYIKPCLEQSHVEEVFFYILRNCEKHGITNDPLHEASSIGELLGLRTPAGKMLTRVRAAIPDLNRDQLLAVLGLRALEPAFNLDHLADAAAGAVGLVDLDTSNVALRARRAATRLAVDRAPLAAIARLFGVTERTVRRFRAAEADPLLERAIGLRMGLRAALGERALLGVPVPPKPKWVPGRAGLLASVK